MLRFLLLFCVLLSSISNAEENSVYSDSISHQILTQKPEAVLFQTEDRLYLRSDKIYPTDKGLFLGDAESAISIPMVFSDSSGCYLPCGSFWAAEKYWFCITYECKNYLGTFRNRSGKCPVCSKLGRPG